MELSDYKKDFESYVLLSEAANFVLSKQLPCNKILISWILSGWITDLNLMVLCCRFTIISLRNIWVHVPFKNLKKEYD